MDKGGPKPTETGSTPITESDGKNVIAAECISNDWNGNEEDKEMHN
jgi:hypothetical protein